jgi:hypothetical protein
MSQIFSKVFILITGEVSSRYVEVMFVLLMDWIFFFFNIFLCSTTNEKTACKNLQGRGTVLNFLNNSV